jgi:hypothetical protein
MTDASEPDQPASEDRPPAHGLRGWVDRLPSPIQWLGSLALWVLAIVALYAGIELAVRLSENVLFPRRVDTAWAQVNVTPTQVGDSWVGNLASDGTWIHFLARQQIQGFWGDLYWWRSYNGGRSWWGPHIVSRGGPTARHTVAVAPDGTVWVGYVEAGPEVATQRLWVLRFHPSATSSPDPIAVSPPSVGLIGLPVFLLTDDVHLVAFTDGETGDLLVQHLTAQGEPDGEPVAIGRTERQLYSDANFYDAAISLASARGKIVVSWIDGLNELGASVSTDGGASWLPSSGIDQRVNGDRPRLATDGTAIILAAADPNNDARNLRHPFIRFWRSTDGGLHFEQGPSEPQVVRLGSYDLLWAGDRWRLVYEGCPGFFLCATPPRVWYTESADGESWSNPIVISEPGSVHVLGLAQSQSGITALWGEGLDSHEWTFHGAFLRSANDTAPAGSSGSPAATPDSITGR